VEENRSSRVDIGIWGVISAGVMALGVLGQKVQESKLLQQVLVQNQGWGMEEFLRGHAKDMASAVGVPVFGIFGSLVIAELSKVGVSGKTKENMARFAAIMGIVVGALWIVIELSNMGGFGVENCGLPSGTCKGDLGDILAFSVPVIAGGIYLSREIIRKRNGRAILGQKSVD